MRDENIKLKKTDEILELASKLSRKNQNIVLVILNELLKSQKS